MAMTMVMVRAFIPSLRTSYTRQPRRAGRNSHQAPSPFLSENITDFPQRGIPEHMHWLKHKDIYGGISSVSDLGMTLVILHDKKIAHELLDQTSGKTSGPLSLPIVSLNSYPAYQTPQAPRQQPMQHVLRALFMRAAPMMVPFFLMARTAAFQITQPSVERTTLGSSLAHPSEIKSNEVDEGRHCQAIGPRSTEALPRDLRT
ncbi:hypothetical protein BDV10DRAFT_187957 [Aspergillus recurvatus]